MAVVGTVTALIASVLIVTFAGANPAIVAGFEVDAKIQRAAANGEDWADGPGGAGVIDDSTATGNLAASRAAICAANTNTNPLLICDPVKSDPSTFPGGAKESEPAGWLPIQTSQVTPKTDITNVYAYGKSVSGSPTILNGMERLPKAGDLHLDFEYNKEMTGTGANQVPSRRVDDILVAYDLGGGRQSNGNAITVRIYKALPIDPTCTTNECAGEYDYEQSTFEAAGTGSISGGGVTAQLNGDTIQCGKWGCYDSSYNLTTTLPAFSFAEAGIDLEDSVGLSSACFNWVTVKSRSSESVTSQLKDTTGPKSFPFCGGMSVHKYIDANRDGDLDTGELDGVGWAFTVNGPAANGGIGPLVCSGVTNSSGNLVCGTAGQSLSDLTPGTYRVTETQQSGNYNTDPGAPGTSYPRINTAGSVSKDVTVGIGAPATIQFGNACLTDVSFTINNVPEAVQSVSVVYSASGFRSDANVTLPLTINRTTDIATATVADRFTPSDTISWSWYVNGESTHALAGTSTPLAGCSTGQTASFALSSISGYKYKDANANGDNDAGDLDGVGFTFELVNGAGTVIDAEDSDADGNYTFDDVAPGTYTVREQAETGWMQTEPASTTSTPATRSVTINLGDGNVPIGDFGNTPLSDIAVSFSNQAVNPGTTNPASEATITCVKVEGTTSTAVGGPQTGNTFAANNLQVGTYDCRVVIVDP